MLQLLFRPRKNLPPPDPRASRSPSCQRSEEHTSELQSLTNLVCRLLLENKNQICLDCDEGPVSLTRFFPKRAVPRRRATMCPTNARTVGPLRHHTPPWPPTPTAPSRHS